MTQSNNKATKLTGFQLHPEHINKTGLNRKEFSMTNALREILGETNPETKIERYKELLEVAVTKAMSGDNDMLKYLINRIEGLPKGESTTNVNVVIPLLGGDSHGISAYNSDREVIEIEESD
jgi:hypothetical protein